MYLEFAFLLFAGNYAIYVISKKWLKVVLMASKHNFHPIHLISIYCVSEQIFL